MSNVLVKGLGGIPQFLRNQMGGARAIRALHGVVTVGDDGSAVVIGRIPEGAFALGVFVDVVTAFDGSGNDFIDVGTNSDADGFAADVDGSSTGLVYEADGALIGEITAADQVEILYTDSGGDATAGEAIVTVLYLEA